MSDYKVQLLQKVELGLSGALDRDDLETAVDVITQILAEYEVTPAVTDLVTYPGVNEMLLNNYCGCLLIGGKSEKTIAQYRRTATKLAEFSGKTFLDIGVYDIRMFLGSERQRGVSNRTVENTRANLSAFFSMAAIRRAHQ